MSELRAGVDRPGGATAKKPIDHRGVGDHRPVFGEPPVSKSRLTAARRRVQETVMPMNIIDPEPEVPGEKRVPLEIGDVRYLSEEIMGYENYQAQQWRRAGGIRPDRYTLTKLVERPNETPLYRWSREHPTKPTRHVYVRPLGPGLGWEKVEPKDENIN